MGLWGAARELGGLITTRESGQTLLTEVGGQARPIGSNVLREGGDKSNGARHSYRKLVNVPA